MGTNINDLIIKYQLLSNTSNKRLYITLYVNYEYGYRE